MRNHTYPADSHTQVYERIYGIHFWTRQSCVLVQSPTVFVWDAFSVLYIQRDDTDLVGVATGSRTRVQDSLGGIVIETYMTSRLSNSGTISSTSVFGVLPSAVNPVEQF